MRVIKVRWLDVYRRLAELEVVTLDDAEWAAGDRELGRKALRKMLSEGLAKRIRAGLYHVFTTGAEGAPPNKFLVASKCHPKAVIALHAALEYHGATHSAFHRVDLYAPRGVHPFSYAGIQYAPRVDRLRGLGVVSDNGMPSGGKSVLVTSVARTIVDCLCLPKLAGGFVELYHSISRLAIRVPADEAYECARGYGTAIACQRVGFMGDLMRDQWGWTDADLNRFRAHVPAGWAYLDPRTRKRGGAGATAWHLIVPPALLSGESLDVEQRL